MQAVRRRRGTAAGPDRPARHPLQPEDRRERLEQVGHPAGGDDGHAVDLKPAPGDVGAVDGHDGGDLDLGHPEDLVSLSFPCGSECRRMTVVSRT
jgi:hypothetical protein